MRPDKPNKTESTFSTNKQVRANAGTRSVAASSGDLRRDKIKDINVSLYDVDYAIKWHLEQIIQPTIMEENSIITVPVLFAAGEKWAAVQRHGYLRDNQGKLLTPLIMIKRNSVSKREDIQDLKVLETPDARITFQRKYTKENRYDRFNLIHRNPVPEMYSVDVPKFVQVEYDLLIWTNNSVQLNEIVEQLMWFDGKAFGDSYKFITHIDPPSFENINSTGEDRIVRATMSMRTKAYILNTHGVNAPALYRIDPVTQVKIGLEVDGITTVVSSTTGNSITTRSSIGVSGTGKTQNISSAIVTYLSTSKQMTGTIIDSTTVQFASAWLAAPSTLPATSIDNFTFFANGVLIERSAIVSFTQNYSLGTSTLVIDSTKLGYTLSSSDEVIGIGKFQNQDSLA